MTNKRLLGGRAQDPRICSSPPGCTRGASRCGSANRKIKQVLGWRPRYSLVEALDRSTEQRCNERPRSRAADVSARGGVTVVMACASPT